MHNGRSNNSPFTSKGELNLTKGSIAMTSQTITAIFDNAEEDGAISPETAQAIQLTNLGGEIQTGMGIEVDDVTASEVVLVTIMPDDSGSISVIREDPTDRSSPIIGPQLIRDGHNGVFEALKTSKQNDGILMHTRYLNGQVLYPYTPLDGVIMMDDQNFDPSLGTPLYDQSVITLSTVVAKAQEFEDNGVPCRTITLLISDGADMHSRRQSASSVAHLVDDMHSSENHIIMAMGIDDGDTDFHKVFTDMGILPRNILTPGTTKSEMRSAFQVFSQSAVRASQGAAGFSKVALGGFGT